MGNKVINTILNLKDNLSSGLVKAAKNTKGVSKEMVSATRSVVKFKNNAVSALSEAAKKTAKLGLIAGGTAVAGMGALAVKAGVAADDLNTLAKQSGFAAEDLQRWKYASDIVDVSTEDIIGAAKKMKKNMASTSADVTSAWQQIGVSTKDSNGQFRDSTAVFYDALGGLSKIKNETERDILAMQLFGKSADSLAGIIDDGGASLKELGDQAKKSGLILGQDALDGANAFNDVIDIMKAKTSASVGKIGNTLATKMLPVMQKLKPVADRLLNGTVKVLTKNIDTLSQKIDKWAADGTIDRVIKKAEKGFGKMFGVAKSAIKWAVTHGDTIKRVLVGVGGAFVFVKGVKIGKNIYDTVKTVVLFGKTVGKVAKNSGKLISFAKKAGGFGKKIFGIGKSLFAFVAANHVVLIIAAIIAAGILLIANWDKVKAFCLKLWDRVKSTFGGIKDSITGAFEGAKAKVGEFFGWIGGKLKWLDDKIESVPVIGSLYKGIKGAGSWVADKISGHATGTSYFAGGLTRVHERGGEIMRLPGGTQIIPHDISRRMVGGPRIAVSVVVQGNVIGNQAYANELGDTIVQRILRALQNV